MASSRTTLKRGFALLGSAALVLALAPSALAQDENEPILIGHLNYRTGDFFDVGPWFAAATDHTVAIINEDPPLNRMFVVIDRDIGTDGEGPVALRLLEQDNVDILLNAAHGYSAYREAAGEYIAANDAPLMPTVHGGGIPPSIGGVAEEPIFRAQPQDSGQASIAVIEAQNRGAKSVVIVATQVDGSQFMKDSAVSGAAAAGLETLDVIDIANTSTDYSSEINKIKDLGPDAVLHFSQAQNGGTFVKQMAEAGMTDTDIIGSSEWTGAFFIEAATSEALQNHKSVLVAAFTGTPGPALEAYEASWEAAGYEEEFDTPGNNIYNNAYHDTLVVTALAIEHAGNVSASSYVDSIREVAMAPGTQCFDYHGCLAQLRAGEDIDYEGISGTNTFSDSGTVDGNAAVSQFTIDADGNVSLDLVSEPDPLAVAALEDVFNASLSES